MREHSEHLKSPYCPRQWQLTAFLGKKEGSKSCGSKSWPRSSKQIHADDADVPVLFYTFLPVFLRKEVSMVLSQWLSSSPPERKRLPKKPTEEKSVVLLSFSNILVPSW